MRLQLELLLYALTKLLPPLGGPLSCCCHVALSSWHASWPRWLKLNCCLQAINPYYLYRFFTTGQESALDAWKSTATIFLCLTGAEASYADLVGVKSHSFAVVGVTRDCDSPLHLHRLHNLVCHAQWCKAELSTFLL